MKAVNFYALPRTQQVRLIDSFAARFAPAPLLFVPGASSGTWTWAVLSVVAMMSLVGLAQLGFGNLFSRLSVQGEVLMVVYGALGFAVAFGLLEFGSRRLRTRSLPWRPGVYLFPAELIDGRQSKLRVYPLGELRGVRPAARSVVLDFGGSTFRFPLPTTESPERVKEAVEAARARMQQQLDQHQLFELDPLQPPSVASPLGPQAAIKPKVLLWERLRIPIAVVVGGAAGVGLHYIRNKASDDAMYTRAQGLGDPAAYRAYLAHGRQHREPVSTLLLPRAELLVAQRAGSVEAIDEFMAKHKSSAIAAEITGARRVALVAAFERAREKGTLSALNEFATRYPDHQLEAALAQARRALFARALVTYRQQASRDDPQANRFVERLLAYAEKTGPAKTKDGVRGPSVQIRFQRLPADTLGRAEIAIARNPNFNGTVSYIGRYLDVPHVERYEKAATNAIVQRFERVFPPELMVFEQGPLFDRPDGELPDVTTPTLLISYRIEWTGGGYESKKPRGIFVGLLYLFKTQFMLPSQPDPYRTRVNLPQGVPLELLKQNPDTPPGQLEETVYDHMSSDAFRQFSNKQLGRFFAPEPKPEPKPEAKPEPEAQPAPQAKPAPKPGAQPAPKPKAKPASKSRFGD